MPGVLDLPDKLLLQIIDYLEDHRDAVSLGVQNRHLYDLCEVALRRKFRRVRIVPNASAKKAINILLEILRKPQLGDHVRHLELDCLKDHGQDPNLTSDEFQQSDLDLLHEAAAQIGIGLPNDRQWAVDMLFPDLPDHIQGSSRDSLVHRSLEILAALLASVSPKLTSIYCCDLGDYVPKIDDWYTMEKSKRPGSVSYFGRFLQQASQAGSESTPYLQKVRQVHFLANTSPLCEGDGLGLTDLYHPFNVIRGLPAIQAVRFDAIGNFFRDMSVHLPPRSANYTEITFSHSSIEHKIFNNIIRSAKALRKLTFSLGGRYVPGADGESHPLKSLLLALLKFHETLEYLDFDQENELLLEEHFDKVTYPTDPEEDHFRLHEQVMYNEEWADELASAALNTKDEKKPPQKLRSLHRLKHLGLGIYSLYYMAQGIGADRCSDDSFSLVDGIPSSLESLRIYGYASGRMPKVEGVNVDLDRHVSQLMQQKATKLQLLKMIEGVDELIPNAKSIQTRENEEFALKREIEAWPDYENEDI